MRRRRPCATAQLRWAEFCYRRRRRPGGGDDDAAAAAELAALRSAVRGYFRYLQLREEGADPLDEVAVPLRLLRLLLRHAATLGGEFDEALKATPALAWRGVVPQLFARLAPRSPRPRPRRRSSRSAAAFRSSFSIPRSSAAARR